MATYDGWQIGTGFLEGNLFGGHEEGIDEAASAARYAELLTAALREAYPGADITVPREGGSGVEGFGLRTYAYSPQNGDERDPREELIEVAIDDIVAAVYEGFEWVVDA